MDTSHNIAIKKVLRKMSNHNDFFHKPEWFLSFKIKVDNDFMLKPHRKKDLLFLVL